MNSESPDLVVLCGGRGDRLKSVQPDLPKVLSDIGGRPFIQILVDEAIQQGFRRFVFCTGHGAEPVRNFLQKAYGGDGTLSLTFSNEDTPLGTAGAVKLAGPHIRSARFFVLNGDSFCPFDLSLMEAFHRQKSAGATVAVVEAAARRDGGFVRMDAEDRIIGFREKSPESSHPYLNAGIYLFEQEVLEEIPPAGVVSTPSSLELDVLPGLIGKRVFGYKAKAELHDIGTPERLERFRNHNRPPSLPPPPLLR